MNEILQAALDYASKGIPVFPCRSKPEGQYSAKSPYTRNGYKDASTNLEQIKCWWANHADATIGMPTGKASGFVVVDIDPRNGGDYSLGNLVSEYGELPQTLTCITGGGGTHYYFRYPDRSVRCSNSKIGSGIDIKGDGGYVIVPPSGHESGNSYYWDGEFDLDQVAEMPIWLLNLTDGDVYDTKEISVDKFESIPKGYRNSTLASLAGTMRRAGMGYEEILVAIKTTNTRRCNPSLPNEEVEKIAWSISKYEPDFAAKAVAENHYEQMFGETKVADSELQLDLVCAEDVQEEEIRWFWPNRIPAGQYSMLVGDPDAGKTFISCYMAAVATTGGIWPDGEAFGDPCNVLMFVTEDSLSQALVPRLRHNKADLSRVVFCQWLKAGDKKDIPFVIQKNLSVLERHLDENPDCKFVMLDPITGYMGDINQNAQSEVREVLIRLRQLAEQRQVTILGLSHLNKKVGLSLNHRSIGSVAFNAVPRAVWAVIAKAKDESDNPETRRFFVKVKGNMCINPSSLEFEIGDWKVFFKGSVTPLEINSVLNPVQNKAKRKTKKEQAREQILSLLEKGGMDADELIQRVISNTGGSISEQTIRNSRKELRDEGLIDCHNPESAGYQWFMVNI